MGLSAEQGLGVAGGIVFIQVLCTVIGGFFAQWVNCEITLVTELSFGLQAVVLQPPALNKFTLKLEDFKSLSSFSDAYQSLLDLSTTTLGFLIAGAAMGLFGVGCAAGGVAQKTPEKQHQRNSFFLAAAGLLGFDLLLTIVAVCIYGFGVMGGLSDLDITDLFDKITGLGGPEVPGLAGWILGSTINCKQQQMMFGMWSQIITIILLIVGTGIVGIGVNTAIRPADSMRTPALQMQHMGAGGPDAGMHPRGGAPHMVPGPHGGQWAPPPPGPGGGPPFTGGPLQGAPSHWNSAPFPPQGMPGPPPAAAGRW